MARLQPQFAPNNWKFKRSSDDVSTMLDCLEAHHHHHQGKYPSTKTSYLPTSPTLLVVQVIRITLKYSHNQEKRTSGFSPNKVCTKTFLRLNALNGLRPWPSVLWRCLRIITAATKPRCTIGRGNLHMMIYALFK